eukprot:GHVN01020511.1.p1 GENE.GHVN01020511.1~~GHVN01020511.1.p1  ORF type:complete len:984 (-),score=94.99 GHVN01020511.1:1999-4950(-)
MVLSHTQYANDIPINQPLEVARRAPRSPLRLRQDECLVLTAPRPPKQLSHSGKDNASPTPTTLVDHYSSPEENTKPNAQLAERSQTHGEARVAIHTLKPGLKSPRSSMTITDDCKSLLHHLFEDGQLRHRLLVRSVAIRGGRRSTVRRRGNPGVCIETFQQQRARGYSTISADIDALLSHVPVSQASSPKQSQWPAGHLLNVTRETAVIPENAKLMRSCGTQSMNIPALEVQKFSSSSQSELTMCNSKLLEKPIAAADNLGGVPNPPTEDEGVSPCKQAHGTCNAHAIDCFEELNESTGLNVEKKQLRARPLKLAASVDTTGRFLATRDMHRSESPLAFKREAPAHNCSFFGAANFATSNMSHSAVCNRPETTHSPISCAGNLDRETSLLDPISPSHSYKTDSPSQCFDRCMGSSPSCSACQIAKKRFITGGLSGTDLVQVFLPPPSPQKTTPNTDGVVRMSLHSLCLSQSVVFSPEQVAKPTFSSCSPHPDKMEEVAALTENFENSPCDFVTDEIRPSHEETSMQMAECFTREPDSIPPPVESPAESPCSNASFCTSVFSNLVTYRNEGVSVPRGRGRVTDRELILDNIKQEEGDDPNGDKSTVHPSDNDSEAHEQRIDEVASSSSDQGDKNRESWRGETEIETVNASSNEHSARRNGHQFDTARSSQRSMSSGETDVWHRGSFENAPQRVKSEIRVPFKTHTPFRPYTPVFEVPPMTPLVRLPPFATRSASPLSAALSNEWKGGGGRVFGCDQTPGTSGNQIIDRSHQSFSVYPSSTHDRHITSPAMRAARRRNPRSYSPASPPIQPSHTPSYQESFSCSSRDSRFQDSRDATRPTRQLSRERDGRSTRRRHDYTNSGSDAGSNRDNETLLANKSSRRMEEPPSTMAVVDFETAQNRGETKDKMKKLAETTISSLSQESNFVSAQVGAKQAETHLRSASFSSLFRRSSKRSKVRSNGYSQQRSSSVGSESRLKKVFFLSGR